MDERHDRQLQRLRDWYRGLTEEEREKRRAAQREYRRLQRLVKKDEINAYKRQKRAENRKQANAKQREYYAQHPDEFKEYQRRSYTKNREARLVASRANLAKANARRRELRLQDPNVQEWHDRQAFFKEYPSARASYYAHGKRMPWNRFKKVFVQARTGPCDICAATRNGNYKRFYLDHRHSDGVYRGVLCQKCNSALGLFGDDPAMLRKAAEYLERQIA